VVRESEHHDGTLPTFCSSLGVDVIITPDDRAVLVELQHGFGRRGLIELFPAENSAYRRLFWRLRRRHGRSSVLLQGLRRICGSKVATWKLLADYQPASHVYRGWTVVLEEWLDHLTSDFILAKPPRGSCGRGILVLDRREFRRAAGAVNLGEAILLQEFVKSRPLLGPEGEEHVGCIRHIVILVSDGERLSFVHLPSYWRVSPLAYVHRADKDALTANISRGAYPVAVSEADEARVGTLCESVTARVVGHVLEVPELSTVTGRRIAAGEV
jgi:hypothetical protein